MAGMWQKICRNLTGSVVIADIHAIQERFRHLPSLTLLDHAFLEQAGVEDGAKRDAVVRCVQQHLQEQNFAVLHPPKLINDPIHGTISLHPLAVVIMNTPQFQRLHYIKQLSLQYYVYPSAGYSRFEHSVGVYHLAGKLVNLLKDRQPELGITAIDAMCVQLAGLCHDLGHGPFSHLFDGTIIPKLRTKCSTEDRKKYENWTHEVASADLLNKICYSNNGQTSDEVLPKISEWGVCKEDIEFINSLIKGKINTDETETGQRAKKSFLYDIVSNEPSGMDVDKWDYLVRDSYHLGLKCGFDPDRLMYHMRVMKITGRGDKEHICVRRKELDSVYSMFHTRYELYRKACQHPVVNGVEMMVAEAIVGAGEHFSLIDCLGDMVAYTKLHDGIFFEIMKSKEEDLKASDDLTKSKYLLERIQRRDLWKCVGTTVIPSKWNIGDKSDEEHLCDMIAVRIVEALKQDTIAVTGEALKWKQSPPDLEFKCKVNTRNFGKKESDPFKEIGFYDKVNPNEATTEVDRSIIFPAEFQQSFLFVYCISERENLQERGEQKVCARVKEVLEKAKAEIIQLGVAEQNTP